MLKLFSGYLSLFESPLTSRVLPRLFRCALELCFCQDRCFWSFACGVVVGLGEGGNTRAHVRELDGWAGGEAEWDEYTLGFYLYCIHGCVLLPISVYTGVIQIILHPWNNRRTVGAFCAREVLPEEFRVQSLFEPNTANRPRKPYRRVNWPRTASGGDDSGPPTQRASFRG